MNRHAARRRGSVGDDRGQVTAFLVALAGVVVLFAGLAVDGGLALAAKVRALSEAQEAARAGAQAVDLEAYRATNVLRLRPDQARDLAQRYLADTGDSGTAIATEQSVTVTVTARQPTRLLRLAGLRTLTVTGSGTAHPRHGVSDSVP
ncbi:TadE/TadG family type IV pilus assembly protein [Streptomyces sp. NPDC054796]